MLDASVTRGQSGSSVARQAISTNPVKKQEMKHAWTRVIDVRRDHSDSYSMYNLYSDLKMAKTVIEMPLRSQNKQEKQLYFPKNFTRYNSDKSKNVSKVNDR